MNEIDKCLTPIFESNLITGVKILYDEIPVFIV